MAPGSKAELWEHVRDKNPHVTFPEPGHVPRISLPCVHVGGPVAPPDRIPTSKRWTTCEHPEHPLGAVVCPCMGCGPACRGYAPDTDGVDDGRHPNIALAKQFAMNIPPYPEGRFRGRGVVISGGGPYWPGAYVAARMLRTVGCTLPIQVWYLGGRERNDRIATLLAPYGVEAVDALAHPAGNLYRNVRGFPGHPPFQAKSFAALHCPFEEVLLLDADNYPCRNPTILFEESRYRLTGGIFWPDGNWTNAMTRWEQWGVEKFGPECGWEVGQYVLHKRTAWRQLNMARWYDDHGDWCYGGQAHHDHGDKGPHRVGWAVFRTAPVVYNTRVVWRHIAFVQPGPDGRTPMFIHRCRSKFVLDPSHFPSTPQTGVNIRIGAPLEAEAFRHLEALREALK